MIPNNILLDKLIDIKALILDLDGVLTNGYVYIGSEEQEFKKFCIHDGLGIKLLSYVDIHVACISTSLKNHKIAQRLQDLGISHYYAGRHNKYLDYQAFKKTVKLQDNQIAYMGDDIIDLPIMRKVGCSIAVPNAISIVKQQAHWVTNKLGGAGAIREVAEQILQAQNTTTKALQAYLAD